MIADRLCLMRSTLPQARSASEGKAVPRWRFGLVGMVLSHLGFQLWIFGFEQKAQLQNWRFGLVAKQTLRSISIQRSWHVVLGALLGLATVGCGNSSSTLPPTYPVTGSVNYKGGGPVAGGAVQFTPVSDPSFSVSGEINDDGSFTLYTVKGNERVKGAPEGEYKVTVQPPIPADHRAVPAIALPKTFHIEAKDNSFSIEVTALSKKP
ncbi:MAG TPA: hypothetical protein VG122_19335 [Gemmata sp.]|nr:hypothetical protein [Gemmata sp.]